MRGGPALRTTSPTLRIVSETGLGRGRVEAINQTSLLRRLGQVFGIDDMKSLGPAQLAGAADNIGGQFDEALKITQPIDLTDVNTALRELPPSNFPGRKAILQQVDNLHATDNSKALRGLHRALRDKAAVMKRNPVLAGFDDQLDNAVGLLDDAATRAGADTGKLREAGQRWKVLKTIEETPEAWIDGRINPRQLATKFGRENVKGFGTALKRGKTDKLAQPVQGFLDDVMNLADDVRVVGRSGTPEGLVAGGGAIAGGAGLMSGAIDPATAGAGLVAYGLIPPLAGAASVGEAAPLVGKALAASRVLADDE